MQEFRVLNNKGKVVIRYDINEGKISNVKKFDGTDFVYDYDVSSVVEKAVKFNILNDVSSVISREEAAKLVGEKIAGVLEKTSR